MAKLATQSFLVQLSLAVKNADAKLEALTQDQIEQLEEVISSMIEVQGVIVEVSELDE